MMFKLNTLHPLDRIRGHAQPNMLPTPRPGRVLHAAAACLGGCCCPLVQKTALPYGNILLYPLLYKRVRVHRGYHPQAARLRARYSQTIRLYTLIDTSLNGCPYHQTVKWLSPNGDMPCRKEVR